MHQGGRAANVCQASGPGSLPPRLLDECFLLSLAVGFIGALACSLMMSNCIWKKRHAVQ